jgi:hypothetical protein
MEFEDKSAEKNSKKIGIFGSIVIFIKGVIAEGAKTILIAAAAAVGGIAGMVYILTNLLGWAWAISVFEVYGLSAYSTLMVLSILLYIIVFIILLVSTVHRHKYYVLPLLTIYFILSIPHSLMMLGGVEGARMGILTVSSLFNTTITRTFTTSLLPMIVLIVTRRLDTKIQRKRQGLDTFVEF